MKKIDICKNDPKKSYTHKIQKHIPYGFTIYLVSRITNKMYKPICYRAKTEDELENVPNELFKYLDKISKYISKKYNQTKPMIITKDQEKEYRKATICHICDKGDFKNDKVKDHCHLTGNYRGPAHSKCNLNLKHPQNIPVFCHNSSNYDTHLFIKELAKKYGKIDLLANTDEKYINYTINSGFGYEFEDDKPRKFVKLSFVDTFRFMASSIEKLAKNLKTHQFKHLNEFIKDQELIENDDDTFKILSSKGIFPYEFIDDIEKLNYDKILEKDKFYNCLTNENISDDDYKHYIKVWNKLKVKTLGNYSDLYNIQDVLLLADIFENFRSVC